MPTSILIGGSVTYRPGVYARVDVSALGGATVSFGNLALVGEFPALEQLVPFRANTAEQIKDIDQNNDELALLAKLIYSPANDDRVDGQPTSVTLVNVQPVTRAFTNYTARLLVRATTWGVAGNRTYFAVDEQSTQFVITSSRDGVSESASYEKVNQVSFAYGGTGMDNVIMEYNPSGSGVGFFQLRWTKTAIAVGTYTAPADVQFDGTISMQPSAAVTNGGTALITGVNRTTNLADTETLTWTAGDTATKTSTKPWKSISTIVSTAAGFAGTFTLSAKAYDLDLTQYTTIGSFVTKVSTGTGWTATVIEPSAMTTPSTSGDSFTSASISGSTGYLTAYALGIRDAINTLAFVSATLTGTVVPVSSLVDQAGYLGGGTESSTADTDIEDALAALRNQDVQIIAMPGLSTLAQHKLLRAHCIYMAGRGKNECCGWVGLPSSTTKTDLKTHIRQLNTRHLAAVFQDADVESPTGATTTIEPSIYAVMHAAIQINTPVATPLTRKIPNVIAVSCDSTIDPNEDADELIAAGVVVTTNPTPGAFQIERSVTTYLTDANRVYSEVSANESINSCIRDLRANLEPSTGGAKSASTRSLKRSRVKTRLADQVKAGIIAWFNETTVNVVAQGDVDNVVAQVAPTEPDNFTIINLQVTNAPAGA